MEYLIQNVIMGIAIGGIYGLIALGFVLINKSTGILNIAQGGMMAIGAFICFTLISKIGVPFVLAIIMTLFISFFLGLVIDKALFSPLIGQPLLAPIMMSLALLFILEGIVLSIWGAQSYSFPQLFPVAPVAIGPFVLSHELFFNFIISGLLLIIFIAFFKFSHTGTKMRAVADDQQAAQAAGIKVKKIFSLAWGIGTGIAALGGISLGMITMLFYGLSYSGLKVLPVIILGGIESILGAIVGGLIIGVLESLAGIYVEPYLKGSKEIVPFVILLIFLVFKPHGLFGLKGVKRI